MRDAVTRLGDFLLERLEDAGCKIDEFRLIVHDKDTHYMSDVGAHNPKLLHVHGLIHFKGGRKGSKPLATLAAALGLAANYVEKPKSGKYAYNNMLAYLIHAKDKEKYPYDPREVVTVRGADYLQIFNENHQRWEQGRAIKTAGVIDESVDWLIERVVTGEITRQQVLLSDELMYVYARNKRALDDAFAVVGDSQIERSVEAYENGDYRTFTLSIAGASRNGKTCLGDEVIKGIQVLFKAINRKFDVYKPPARYPMDGYSAQAGILFAEFGKIDDEDKDISLGELLVILSDDEIGGASARYVNKEAVPVRLVVIPSTVDPLSYWLRRGQVLVGDELDTPDQILARLDLCVRAVRYGPEKIGDYTYQFGVPRFLDKPKYGRTFRVEGNSGRWLTYYQNYDIEWTDSYNLEDAVALILDAFFKQGSFDVIPELEAANLRPSLGNVQPLEIEKISKKWALEAPEDKGDKQ